MCLWHGYSFCWCHLNTDRSWPRTHLGESYCRSRFIRTLTMPVTETKAPRQLSDGNTAGTVLGQSSLDLIAFYNSTPVPQLLQGSLAGLNGLLTVYATSQSPAAVTAHTTSEVSMTVNGIVATDMIVAIVKPTAQAGLAVGTARTSTTSTVAASFGNVTGATVTPTTTETYFVVTASADLQFPTITISPAPVPPAS